MKIASNILKSVVFRVDYDCSCAAWKVATAVELMTYGIRMPSAELYGLMSRAVATLGPSDVAPTMAAARSEFARLYGGPENRLALLKRAGEVSAIHAASAPRLNLDADDMYTRFS